jgi:hypothetical protein
MGSVADGNILFECYANQHFDMLDDKTNGTPYTDLTTPIHFLHKTMIRTVQTKVKVLRQKLIFILLRSQKM